MYINEHIDDTYLDTHVGTHVKEDVTTASEEAGVTEFALDSLGDSLGSCGMKEVSTKDEQHSGHQ